VAVDRFGERFPSISKAARAIRRAGLAVSRRLLFLWDTEDFCGTQRMNPKPLKFVIFEGLLILPILGFIFPNMGRIETVSLSDALFSKVQQRVLALLFGQPERSFYTSEVVRSVHSGTGAVERELSRLRSSGLVSVERIGNQKHYRANRDSPIFEELQSLVLKTVGLAEPIRKSLQPYADAIKAAFVYGSVAKGTDTARSDIDLMVIGDELNYSDLYTAAQDAEQKLRRKVNPTFLSPKDWQRKASERGSVVNKISASPKIFIFGSEKDLHPWANKSSTIS
jgi:predicted nucleotidyltransferase